MTSSEDVLLQVGPVRHKKGDGTLYVMSQHVAFILNSSDTVAISHHYRDIKMQKISSEFKNKVQLQLVFHDETISLFQFTNPERSEAMRDRNRVKDLILKLLPKYQKQANKEFGEKNRILSDNRMLYQLYQDLVITHVITSEEFWSHHVPYHLATQSKAITQKTGVPNNFLTNVTVKSDGTKKFNLSNDTIQCIFKTYPAVRQKHIEHVPHQLTESEFWQKFLESHYFHKDRITSGTTKDLFNDCAKLDDNLFKNEIKDLSQNGVDCYVGLIEDDGSEENVNSVSEEKPSSMANLVHDNIIKRFNQHSMMVLKTCEKSNSSSISNSNDLKVSQNSSHVNGVPENSLKRLKIKDKICFDDLNPEVNTDDVNQKRLKLSRVESYVNCLTREQKNDNVTAKLSKARDVQKNIIYDVYEWSKTITNQVIEPSAAVNTLGLLTPGGSLMKGISDESASLAQLVPATVEKDLRQLYISLGELLRHFWSCFPVTTPALEEKLVKTHESLHKFQNAKIKPFEDQIIINHGQLNQLTNHLNLMLHTAYNKFSMWHSRRKIPNIF
ncbi:general transcription factor IIH subunit 1 [Adelges cooleyi]|uniref:general transcription factor IIH subunit 1 n=1 Tax=Adelges cooleyi TaxID=133065 RepID=UPI00217FA4AA|nr:general transcription factor IIH subunit 1 [Adelges cooleyi]XP_050441838.1 general transcription factor IIH subunit 1 [Adelges cooleyi]